MYTFANFVKFQSEFAVRYTEDHMKQFSGENVVACAFVDVNDQFCEARLFVEYKLWASSVMVHLIHQPMVQAIMTSNADHKVVPCGPNGRGIGVFFAEYSSALTIVVGDDVPLEPIINKSDYVMWIHKKPFTGQLNTPVNHSIFAKAFFTTSDGPAYMTFFKACDFVDVTDDE